MKAHLSHTLRARVRRFPSRSSRARYTARGTLTSSGISFMLGTLGAMQKVRDHHLIEEAPRNIHKDKLYAELQFFCDL